MSAKIKRLFPKTLLRLLRPVYHFLLAFLGALVYRFPSRHIVIVGVTGTKGKSSTAEILGNIFDAAGYNTAVLGTIKFQIGNKTERNLKKMTMPGRFFVQKFLREAVDAGCTHAVIEMTSEGAKQFRQRFINMNALIFTNLSPEHIESHGSYEKYRDAKLAIARTLSRSRKQKRFMVVNGDDIKAHFFLDLARVIPVSYSLTHAKNLIVNEKGSMFMFHGKNIISSLGGTFNVYNILGAATCAIELGVTLDAIARGVSNTRTIAGRMEHIDAGQAFPVVVDYAHTPDSLEAIYGAYKDFEMICVLGNTGGGRDKWKRPIMGSIADKYCSEIILTNEDPYDEDPQAILTEIAGGIKVKKPTIILDRREAIAIAILHACEYKKPAILITGKGTDPFIMGPNGSKFDWDDRAVAREEIMKSLSA